MLMFMYIYIIYIVLHVIFAYMDWLIDLIDVVHACPFSTWYMIMNSYIHTHKDTHIHIFAYSHFYIHTVIYIYIYCVSSAPTVGSCFCPPGTCCLEKILHVSGGCGFLLSKELRSHQSCTGEPSGSSTGKDVGGTTTTTTKMSLFFFLTATKNKRGDGVWVHGVWIVLGFYGSIFHTGKLQRGWTFWI